MANAQTPAPSTTTPSPSTDAARGTDALSLDRLRGAVPIAEHAAQFAAQAQLEAVTRDLEVSNAKVRDLEAAASKAATVEGAQRHELALVERKHSLELERQRQQWALDDARRERDRQLAEVDRARSAVATAQHVAEIRRQCDAIAGDIAALRAACSTEQARINRTSVAIGVAGGALVTFIGLNLRAPGKRPKRPAAAAAAGVAGVASAAAPFVLPMLRPASSLPQPSTPSGLDAYLLSLIAERDHLHGELAALRATVFSPMALGAGAAGAGAITYAIVG